ncbi:MAG: argininosuccinate lyase [Phycisphaeraceae bacterium]|nr:argininosuccinate lyase [Phycisphaeraceae bacterium]
MTTLYAGRFSGAADDLFRSLNNSLPFDRTLVQEDVEGSIAWARALERCGVLNAEERDRLIAALREVARLAIESPESIEDADDEDVHSWVERELVARVGDLGKKLHTGRSRNDQVATDLRLWTLRQITLRQQELEAAVSSFVALAERERGTVIPGFTHLQRAQPILFSHWCLAYAEMLARDRDRFEDAAERASECPLGSGALAGTAYPIDREALAGDLGFSGPTANSLDAVSDRDFVVEALAAAALCAVHLSRLAEDLIFYTSAEAGFIELPDSVTSGSSLMPQKKNPDACELLRGKTGRMLGSLVSVLTVLKGLPLAYNKDLQEDKEPLFDAMAQLSMSLRIVPRILEGLRVDRERTRRAAEGSYANATELADYLVGKGVPFRDAHHQVGRLVRKAIEQKTPLEALPVEELAELAPRISGDVYVNLTVDAALNKRSVAGGTAPERVAEGIERAKRRLGARRKGATVRRTRRGDPRAPVVEFRDARMEDIDDLCRLVDLWALRGENLPRTRDDILEKITDFGVATVDGAVAGCASLWVYTPQLAEIRSLGVNETTHGQGLGSGLVQFFLEKARSLGIPKVFVLTRAPKFFERCGFRQVSVNSLPEKILKDCSKCPKNTACDEIAMVIETGATIPQAALAEPHDA